MLAIMPLGCLGRSFRRLASAPRLDFRTAGRTVGVLLARFHLPRLVWYPNARPLIITQPGAFRPGAPLFARPLVAHLSAPLDWRAFARVRPTRGATHMPASRTGGSGVQGAPFAASPRWRRMSGSA